MPCLTVLPMTDRSLRRSRLKGSRIAPVSHESRASRTEPSPAAANRVRNERTSAASDTSSAARSLDHAWYQRYHQFFSSTEHDHQSRGTHTAAFAPATADTSPLEASQRSALSRRRSGLWRQRSHRARPHSGRDRAARRTAARAVHVYPANNRGGAARRRVVIGTTWPRRRRKSAAARMTPGRRWAQNDVVRSEVGTNCAAGLAARRAARGGRSNGKSRVVCPQDSYERSCGWCG